MVFTVLPIFFFLILMFLKINSSSYWIMSNEFKITFEIPKILVNGHGTFRFKKWTMEHNREEIMNTLS